MVQAWVGRSERDEGEGRAVARGSPDMGLWTRRYIECTVQLCGSMVWYVGGAEGRWLVRCGRGEQERVGRLDPCMRRLYVCGLLAFGNNSR